MNIEICKKCKRYSSFGEEWICVCGNNLVELTIVTTNIRILKKDSKPPEDCPYVLEHIIT